MPLTPEMRAAFLESIQNGDINIAELSGLDARGRSPLRPRQLNSLLVKPTKDNPRPDFHWSADPPVDYISKATEFPKLMWSPKGQEITVISKDQQGAYTRQGYLLVCPADVVIEPMDLVKAQWEALSVEDRTALADSYRQDRRNALLAKMGTLDPVHIEALLAAEERQTRRKSA